MALAAAFAGLFCAGVLSVAHVLDLPVPCGASRGCATVASHSSSKLFGVPIAFFGLGTYLVQIVLLTCFGLNRRALSAVVALAGAGTVVSAGLLFYSQTVIHATCPWCIGSGLAMTILFITGLILLTSGKLRLRPPASLVWTLGLATAIGLGIEAGVMERAALTPPISADALARIPTQELLNVSKSRGPADAVVSIIVFADFLCPACRTAIESLQTYQKNNPQTVRLVYRHQPLTEIRGHAFSKAAAALSEIAAEQGKFWEFADAVHAARGTLTREGYLELMHRLGFEPQRVVARLSDEADPAIAGVQHDIDFAARLGIQATPTFVLQIGTSPPFSASQRGLPRILNSPAVISILASRHQTASLR